MISKQNPLESDKLLTDFEAQFQIKLPERYKQFLQKYNGGDTPETRFKSGRESSDVRYFYGLGDVEYDLLKIIDLSEFIADQVLPIARDSFGNYIALRLDAEQAGTVVFCDHEKDYNRLKSRRIWTSSFQSARARRSGI